MKALKRGWILLPAILLAALTGAFAIHRVVLLATGDGTIEALRAADPFDARYLEHPVLSYLHILPGFLFLLLGPIQFSNRIRARWLNFHRWSGRMFLASGLFAALASLPVAVRFPAFGGNSTTVATFLFALFVMYCLVQGYLHIRRGEIDRHREWMMRAFAVGLGAGTVRLLLIVAEATAGRTVGNSFAIAFWVGFTLNAVVIEFWIRHSRRKLRRV